MAKASKWFSTPASRRHRKGVQIMLSDEERSAAELIAIACDVPLSRVVAAALDILAQQPKAKVAEAVAAAVDRKSEKRTSTPKK